MQAVKTDIMNERHRSQEADMMRFHIACFHLLFLAGKSALRASQCLRAGMEMRLRFHICRATNDRNSHEPNQRLSKIARCLTSNLFRATVFPTKKLKEHKKLVEQLQ